MGWSQAEAKRTCIQQIQQCPCAMEEKAVHHIGSINTLEFPKCHPRPTQLSLCTLLDHHRALVSPFLHTLRLPSDTLVIRILVFNVTHEDAGLRIPTLEVSPSKFHDGIRGFVVSRNRCDIFLGDVADRFISDTAF